MSSQLFGYSSSSDTSSSSSSSLSSASTSPKPTTHSSKLAGPTTIRIESSGKENTGVDFESFAQLAISKEVMENTLKTLYNRRHSARQLSDITAEKVGGARRTSLHAIGTKSGSSTPFSEPEGTITPTPLSALGGASLRISTTATTPRVHQQAQQHKRESSLSASSTVSESLPSLVKSPKNTTTKTNHSAHSSISSTDFTLSSSSSPSSASSSALLTPTAYPSPSYTANLNTPKTSFSTNSSLSTSSNNSSSVPNTAYSSLSSTSYAREKPTFTHFDFLSSASSSSTSVKTSGASANTTVVSRPPLLRSVSEDVVVNHRSDFPIPAGIKYTPTSSKAGGALQLSSNGRALTTGIGTGKLNTRLRTQTVNSPLRSGASLDTDDNINDSIEASGSTPLSTDGQWQSHTRTQSAAATSTIRGDQRQSSMFDSYYGFEEHHKRANTTGGIGASGYMNSSASYQSQQQQRERSRDYASADSFNMPTTFDEATAEAVRRAAAFVRSTTGGGVARSTSPPPPEADGQHLEESIQHARFQQHVHSGASVTSNAGIMGSCGNGYFGNAIRSKAMEILYDLIPGCTSALEHDTISIVEYGSLNSLSASLVKPVIQRLREQKARLAPIDHDDPPSWTITHSDLPGSDFRHLMKQQESSISSSGTESDSCYINSAPNIFPAYTAKPFSSQIVPPKSVSVGWSLMDLHVRRSIASTGVSPQAAAHSELIGFLQTRAKEFKKDGLLVLAFIQRKEDDITSLTKSVRQTSVPTSRVDDPDTPRFTSPLSGSKAPLPLYLPDASAPSSCAGSITASTSSIDSQLSSACTSIASSPAGASLPILDDSSATYMRRSRSGSSPCQQSFSKAESTNKNDIWTAIPALLAPCIQRLVSTGLIKSDTAHQLLALPLHPRTPSQTQAVLRAVSQQWKVEWSCGLDGDAKADSSTDISPTTPTPLAHTSCTADQPQAMPLAYSTAGDTIREEALHLSHPAYTAFSSTTLSRVQFAEHALQFVRVLYETHFRSVLRDQARLSRSRVEEVLDSLNEVIREKIEEPNRAILALEMDVCMIALRRT